MTLIRCRKHLEITDFAPMFPVDSTTPPGNKNTDFRGLYLVSDFPVRSTGAKMLNLEAFSGDTPAAGGATTTSTATASDPETATPDLGRSAGTSGGDSEAATGTRTLKTISTMSSGSADFGGVSRASH